MDEILAVIPTIMTNSSLSEPFYKAVLKRLVSLGYIPKYDDRWAVCFAMQKVENDIRNLCNITSIPDGLFNIAVNRSCGEFLFSKKQSGGLTDDFNLEVVVKQVKEGDTTVSFGDGSQSSEQRLNSLISHLITNGEGDFTCYRKLQW